MTALRGWRDYDLEQHGWLTHLLRYDADTDKYAAVSWKEAFADIGNTLKTLNPKSVVFYASGRVSLETSYLYGLMARLYGSQNLPDRSNMCHESTSLGLKAAICVPVGTTQLQHFEHCDAIFFGQNVGSNAPRMLHDLRDARKRGIEIFTFNPLKERGRERFADPQNPLEMATLTQTGISTRYHQVKAGGDIAAMMASQNIWWNGMTPPSAPALRLCWTTTLLISIPMVLKIFSRPSDADWAAIEMESGLLSADLEQAARVYLTSSLFFHPF